MKNLSLLLSLIFIISCSQETSYINSSPEQDNSIIGGQDVRAGDPRFSSTVGIIMIDKSGNPTGVCTGTLIRSDVVLTAAHCILSSDNSKSNFIIYFGDTLLDFSQLGSYRSGVTSVIHEKYVNGLGKEAYDIALIKFSGELPSGYAPIPMLKEAQYLENNTEVIAAGYGRNKRYSRSSLQDGTGQLRQVKLNISDINFSDIEFSSSSWTKGICLGDSGGPAYVNIKGQLHLAGVSNRVLGIGRFNCIYMSVFLRVDKFQSWIEQKMLTL